MNNPSGFLPGIFLGAGAKSIVLQVSIVGQNFKGEHL